jgi:hypothetical protein
MSSVLFAADSKYFDRVNTLNTKMDPSTKLSPYRAVNTLRLSYKNESVNAVQGNNCCLF